MIEKAAIFVLPGVILLSAILMLHLGKRGGEAFVRGARSGLSTTVSLIPAMLMLTVGLTMFAASGAVEWLAKSLSSVCGILGIPPELLPLIITRPVSGSASTATFADLIAAHGADSPAGLAASVMMGSSDTLIYVISVYFTGARGVCKTRHAFPVAAIVMVICVLLSCYLCRVLL